MQQKTVAGGMLPGKKAERTHVYIDIYMYTNIHNYICIYTYMYIFSYVHMFIKRVHTRLLAA